MVRTILSMIVSFAVGFLIFYNARDLMSAVAFGQMSTTVIMGGFIMYTLEKQNKKNDEKPKDNEKVEDQGKKENGEKR